MAYILYAYEDDAEAAIAHMHEAQIDGATINVSIVLPRRKFSPPPPVARRGANFDPRNPPPGFRGSGPGGMPIGGGGGRGWRAPPGPPPGGVSRYGPRSDTYRPRSMSRSRSRSPPDTGRGRYRSRSVTPYSSRSRSPTPGPRRRGRRDYDDFARRRSPSRDSYERPSRSRGRADRGPR